MQVMDQTQKRGGGGITKSEPHPPRDQTDDGDESEVESGSEERQDDSESVQIFDQKTHQPSRNPLARVFGMAGAQEEEEEEEEDREQEKEDKINGNFAKRRPVCICHLFLCAFVCLYVCMMVCICVQVWVPTKYIS